MWRPIPTLDLLPLRGLGICPNSWLYGASVGAGNPLGVSNYCPTMEDINFGILGPA